MAAKKLLSTILNERTESIEYRAIRKQLMIQAQNRKSEFLVLKAKMNDHAITQLQNEGITVKEIEDHGFRKYLLSW